VAAALATLVNVAIDTVGKAFFNLPFAVPMQAGAAPGPLPIGMVIVMSAVLGVLAAGVLYGLQRGTRHALSIFQGVAAVLVLLSLAGPLTLPIDRGTMAALAAMHLTAAASIVGVLRVQSSRLQRVVQHD
jgi:hypothetical protein